MASRQMLGLRKGLIKGRLHSWVVACHSEHGEESRVFPHRHRSGASRETPFGENGL